MSNFNYQRAVCRTVTLGVVAGLSHSQLSDEPPGVMEGGSRFSVVPAGRVINGIPPHSILFPFPPTIVTHDTF